MVDIIVSGQGDHTKLVWELMALAEKAEEKKDLSVLQDRYILAEKAGFRLKTERQTLLSK